MTTIKKLAPLDIICLVSGKCGSSSLNETFNRNGYKCIKTHSKDCFKKQFKYDGLIDIIKRSSLNKELYIIGSYRTPIERKISSFFQNIHKHVPNYKNKSCEELIDIFNTLGILILLPISKSLPNLEAILVLYSSFNLGIYFLSAIIT